MRIRLIVPVLTRTAAAPLADQVAFFMRRGDEVRLYTAAPARDLPPVLAQLVHIVEPDRSALARRPDFPDGDLYVFYYAAPHPLVDAVYTLGRGVALLFFPLRAEPDAPVAETDSDLVRLLNSVDLVAVESETMAAWLSATGAIQPERLHIVSPAVSLADFSPDSPDLELQRTLGLVGRRVLLAMSPCEDAEQQEALAAFMRRVRRRVSKALLAYAGGSQPVEESKFSVRLPALSDPTQAYRLADVFLAFDGSRETVQAALEAAACGLPLLEMRPGALDVLLAGQEPIPLDDKAKDAAAATAIRLLSDDVFYGMMVQRSLDLAARHAQEVSWAAWGRIVDTACDWLPRRERAAGLASPSFEESSWKLAASRMAEDSRRMPFAPSHEEQTWTIADDLAQLKEMAHVMLKGYQVRSPTPVAGPLIAWVRRNLTSHLREPYIDPTLQRQEAFNLRVIAGIEELAARLDEAQAALGGRTLDQAHASTIEALARAAELAAQAEDLLASLPVDENDPAQAQAAADLRAGLAELQRLFAGPPEDAVE